MDGPVKIEVCFLGRRHVDDVPDDAERFQSIHVFAEKKCVNVVKFVEKTESLLETGPATLHAQGPCLGQQ